MAHELYQLEDGRESMGYIGETPWHGLGQKLQEDSPLEVWAKECGLDWELNKKPLMIMTGEDFTNYPGRVALCRSDNGKPLSIMSDTYRIVQPAEILEFYRGLIETGGFKMDTAGSLFEGRKIWALARLGESATIKGDKLDGFLLLSTSCDGSLATTAQFTSIRVVCNNTLTFAVDSTNHKYAIKVPHCRQFVADEVKMELGLAHNAWGQHIDEITAMVGRRLRKREAVMALVRAMGDPELAIEDQPRVRAMGKIIDLFDGGAIGSEMVSAKSTAWGLVNAVSQYSDHNRTSKSRDTRLDSAWFGEWEKIKQSVYREALMLAA